MYEQLLIEQRSNQSILKEINPEYSLEGLMLKLKLQYFSHLMRRADSLEKTLMLGKVEGKKRRGQQRMRWVYSITNSKDVNLSKLQKIEEDKGTWCAAVHGVTKSQTWLSNWTTTEEDNFKCHLWILFSFLWGFSANTAWGVSHLWFWNAPLMYCSKWGHPGGTW